MCKCLTGNVACCCFNCALSMLVSIISGFFVLFVIIGLVVYFVYYHDKDGDLHDQIGQIGNDAKDKAGDLYNDLKNKLSS